MHTFCIADLKFNSQFFYGVPSHGTGPPFPGYAIPGVRHSHGPGFGVRDRVRVRVRDRVRVRVRRTVGMADPGSGGPWEWRTGTLMPVSHCL